MSTTLKIAETARRSGFTASTLRYYEDIGLMPPPARTEAGYRCYDEEALARLSFIARAKQLGCSLDEITDLLAAWEGRQCAPVQTRLRDLVANKIKDGQRQMTELAAFTAQLRRGLAGLGQHTPDGPCDEQCGCSAVEDSASGAPVTAVALTSRAAGGSDMAIACTLGAEEIQARLGDWQGVLAFVHERGAIDQGIRLVLGHDAPIAKIAELAAAEQRCCQFFAFALTVDSRGVALEVRAPAAALDLVTALFGRLAS